ncbi:MAG: sodium-dependent transporter [Coriobacteriaceae bacterium]
MADGGDFFTGFITSNAESYIWMLVFMAIVFAVVSLGVKGGIEKANLFMMPALIVMAVGIAVYTLTMPGALDGALYYLVPDFSKFSPELVIGALGQMFYSLSLAMGIMITYGSYMRKQDSLTSSVVRIGGFDLGVSFIAGLLIVSAAFVAMGSGDAVAAKAGPSLMFVTLPTVFDDMGGMATFIGFLFFLLVLFAALTSAISLVETLVSIVHDGLQCTRQRPSASLSPSWSSPAPSSTRATTGCRSSSPSGPVPRSSISPTSSPTRCSCPSWRCSPACSSAGS